MKKNGQSYYFHLNHRGDAIKVTNASETVVASYSYDPWGNILSSTGSFKDEQPFRYASYFWDEEIGMYYLINRYYDPVIGRFISKDPAGDPEEDDEDPAETNPYVYAANNPVMAIDPDGLNPKLKQGDSDATYVPLIKSMLLLIGRYVSGEPNYDAMITNNYGANFGPGLDKAVRAFQGLHGLAAHGTVGDWTWAELYRQNGIAAAIAAAANGQAGSPAGGQVSAQMWGRRSDPRIDSGDKADYRNWLASRWPSYIGGKSGKDCADLAIQILVDYVYERQLSLELWGYHKSYDSNDYSSKQAYLNDTQGYIDATMLADSKNTVRIKKWSTLKMGDLIILKAPSWDTKVVISNFVSPTQGRMFHVLHQNPDEKVQFQVRALSYLKQYKPLRRRWKWQSG